MEIPQILTTILAIPTVLFAPGFVISYIFFSTSEIDIIERIALSFALSIAIVPLSVFYTNLMGVKITQINVLLHILAILAISILILILKQRRKRTK